MSDAAQATATDPANATAPVVLMDAAVSAYIAHCGLKKCMALRDEFVGLSTHGRYTDKAGMEWRSVPLNWRMLLLMVAGIGQEVESLRTLAGRDWKELPPPEREQIRGIVREGKRVMGKLVALAARV